MNNVTHNLQIFRAALFALLLLPLATGCRQSAADLNARGASQLPSLAQQMIGTWVHVGRPGQVVEIPEIATRLKYRTGTHWAVTHADESGLVMEHFGGTYTLTNDQYVETQHFGDETWMKDNGKSFKFIVKVEGDTMLQFGLDNPYTEVWMRVKQSNTVSQVTQKR